MDPEAPGEILVASGGALESIIFRVADLATHPRSRELSLALETSHCLSPRAYHRVERIEPASIEQRCTAAGERPEPMRALGHFDLFGHGPLRFAPSPSIRFPHFDVPRNFASSAACAGTALPWIKWAYRIVIVNDLCPSCSAISTNVAPFCAMMLAHEWRRSCQ
jgi:hypothetical protein